MAPCNLELGALHPALVSPPLLRSLPRRSQTVDKPGRRARLSRRESEQLPEPRSPDAPERELDSRKAGRPASSLCAHKPPRRALRAMDAATTPPLFVGIDVSKDHLDVATSASQSWRIPNEPAAIEALAEQLHAQSPNLVVLEATGRYEAACAAALATAGVPVAVVNPRQVRDFARATGHSRRPTPSTRRCSRSSPSASAPSLDRSRTPRRRRSGALAAASAAPPHARGREEPGTQGHVSHDSELGGAIRWLERELAAVEDDLDAAIAPAWCGEPRRTSSAACPGWGACWRRRCLRNCRTRSAQPTRDRGARGGGPAQP